MEIEKIIASRDYEDWQILRSVVNKMETQEKWCVIDSSLNEQEPGGPVA